MSECKNKRLVAVISKPVYQFEDLEDVQLSRELWDTMALGYVKIAEIAKKDETMASQIAIKWNRIIEGGRAMEIKVDYMEQDVGDDGETIIMFKLHNLEDFEKETDILTMEESVEYENIYTPSIGFGSEDVVKVLRIFGVYKKYGVMKIECFTII